MQKTSGSSWVPHLTPCLILSEVTFDHAVFCDILNPRNYQSEIIRAHCPVGRFVCAVKYKKLVIMSVMSHVHFKSVRILKSPGACQAYRINPVPDKHAGSQTSVQFMHSLLRSFSVNLIVELGVKLREDLPLATMNVVPITPPKWCLLRKVLLFPIM